MPRVITFTFPTGTALPEPSKLVLLAGRHGCVLRKHEPHLDRPMLEFAVPIPWTDLDTRRVAAALRGLGLPVDGPPDG